MRPPLVDSFSSGNLHYVNGCQQFQHDETDEPITRLLKQQLGEPGRLREEPSLLGDKDEQLKKRFLSGARRRASTVTTAGVLSNRRHR